MVVLRVVGGVVPRVGSSLSAWGVRPAPTGSRSPTGCAPADPVEPGTTEPRVDLGSDCRSWVIAHGQEAYEAVRAADRGLPGGE